MRHWRERVRALAEPREWLRAWRRRREAARDIAEAERASEARVLADAELFLSSLIGTPGYLRCYELLEVAIEAAVQRLVGGPPTQEAPGGGGYRVEERNAERWWLSGWIAGLEYARDLPTDLVARAEQIKEERRRRYGERAETTEE